jgi:hypothetical protein
MSLSGADLLLIASKMICNGMDDLAKLGVDAPVFFGMGQALNINYCILRKIPPSEIGKIKPIEMMAWIREQPIPGLGVRTATNVEIGKLVN